MTDHDDVGDYCRGWVDGLARRPINDVEDDGQTYTVSDLVRAFHLGYDSLQRTVGSGRATAALAFDPTDASEVADLCNRVLAEVLGLRQRNEQLQAQLDQLTAG